MKSPAINSFLLALTFFTSGLAAATVPPVEPAASQAQDAPGTVIFYRPKAFFAAGMHSDILLDGKVVGESVAGRKFSVELPAGVHKVTVPNSVYSGERALEITVASGATVYVRTSMGASAWGGRTNVELIDAAVAESEAAKLRAERR